MPADGVSHLTVPIGLGDSHLTVPIGLGDSQVTDPKLSKLLC